MAREAAARQIICGTDGSDAAHRALTVAADVADRWGAQLHLVHVWDGLEPEFPGESRRDLNAEIRRLGSRTIKVQGHVLIGAPAEVLLTMAHRWSASLIVVGSHGRGRLGRMLWGSTTEDVLDGAEVPVLVVREETEWPPKRVIVGDDGTRAARLAGDVAAELAKAFHVRVTLVHSVPAAGVVENSDSAGRRLVEVQNQLRARAEELAESSGNTPRTSIHLGGAGHVLERAAGTHDGATLLAVGRRRHLDPDREGPLPNSVSTQLLRETSGALLIHPDVQHFTGKHVPHKGASAPARRRS